MSWIDCKQIGTTKLITIRFLAMLAAVLLPITILSFESLIPLIEFSAETGIAIDVFAFLKYIVWWLLPTAMIVTSSGMFLTILTSMPIAILVQFVWWFIDTSLTALSGDTKIFTLMIRHNLLRGSELIKQDFNLICLNRGLFVILSLILIALSVVVYNKKRGGKLNYDFFLQKHFGFLRIDLPLTFKNSLLLAAVYTFIIPVIRGISNLDNIHSADVFGQSLALIGVFLFIPIIRQNWKFP